MSDVIENQIVQMSFDNKEFERNISTSMQSLEKFKESMEFDESTSNFKELEKASEQVDFEKLNKSVDSIADHFTIVGRVIYKVTDEIANYFTSKITGAVNAIKSVTTDIIDPKAGYAKYDQYTHGVKTILSALSDEELAKLEKKSGSAIAGVEEKLSELMAYTDETSYNFVDMVSTIGKFLGAGISLDSAVADMQGIANWAALAGQNATTASQAMYQMSQALGAGYVKYQDWAQMANLKNMGTTAAKDVFIAAAKKVGTITDEDIKHAKEEVTAAGGLAKNYRNWFFEAEQLNKETARWFTTEVLEEGLQMFSSVSNEVISLADNTDISVTRFLRAGKEVKKGNKTIAQSMEDFRKSGAYTEEELRQIEATMRKVTSSEYELGWNAFLAAQEAVTFGEAIDATKDAVSTGWMKIFTDLIGNYEDAAILWTDLANNLWDIFAGPLDSLHEELSVWAKDTVTIIDDSGEEIELTMREHMWAGLSRVFAGMGAVISNTLDGILGEDWDFASAVVSAFDKITYGLHRFADILDAIAASDTVGEVNNILRQSIRIVSSLFTALKKLVSAIAEGLGYEANLDGILASLLHPLGEILRIVAELLEKLVNSKGFNAVLKALTYTIEALTSVTRVLASVFYIAGQMLYYLFHGFEGFNKFLSDTFYQTEIAIIKLWSLFCKVFNLNSSTLNKGFNFIHDGFENLRKGFHGLKESIGDLIDGFRDAENPIEHLGEVASDAGHTIYESLSNLVNRIIGYIPTPIYSKIENILSTIKETILDFIDNSKEFFKKRLEDASNLVFNTIPEQWDKMCSNFQNGETGVQKLKSIFVFIGEQIGSGVKYIIDSIADFLDVDLTPFKEKILNFVDTLTKQLERLKPGFEEGWKVLKDVFKTLVEVFNMLAEALFDIIERVTGIENFGPDKFIDLLFWVLEKILSFAVWFLSGVANIIIAVGPQLVAVGEVLIQGIQAFWLAIMYMFGADKSPEALKAFENVRKVMAVIIGVILLLQVYKFFRAVRWACEGFSDLSDIISGAGVQNFLRNIAVFVASIAGLVLAVAFLSNQDIGGIAMAVVTLGVITKIVIVAIKNLVKITKELAVYLKAADIKPKDMELALLPLEKTIKLLLKIMRRITLSLTILATTTRLAGADEMSTAFISLTMTMLVMIRAVKTLGKVGQQLNKDQEGLQEALKAMRKVVFNLGLLAAIYAALVKFLAKTMNSTKGGGATGETEKDAEKGKKQDPLWAACWILLSGIVVLTAATIGIAKAGKKLSKEGDKINITIVSVSKVATGIVIIAGVMWALMYTLDQLDAETLPERFGMALSFVGVAALIFYLALKGISQALTNVPETMGQLAGTLVKMQASLVLINTSLIFMGVMAAGVIASVALIAHMFDTDKPFELIGAIGAVTLIYLAAAAMLKTIAQFKIESCFSQLAGMAIIITALAGGIWALTKSLWLLSNVGLDSDAFVTLAMLGGILLVISALALFVSKMLPVLFKTTQKFALLMVEITGAMMLFATTLLISKLFSLEDLAIMAGLVLGFIALMVTVGAVAAMAGGAILALNALAHAMLGIAVAFAIMLGIVMLFALVDGLADQLIEGISNLTDRIPELVEVLVQLLAVLLESLAQSIADHAAELGQGLIHLIIALAGVVWETLVALWEDVIGPLNDAFDDLIDNIRDFFSDIWDNITGFFAGVWEWITSLPDRLFESGHWLIAGFIEGIYSALGWLWDVITWWPKKVIEIVKSLFGIASPSKVFDGFGANVIQGFIEGIKSLLSNLWELVKSIPKKVIEWFKNGFGFIGSTAKAFVNMGKDLLEGLVNGIKDAVGKVLNAAKDVGDKVLNKFKSIFGIHSPSTETASDGKNLMLGLVEGLKNNSGEAIGAAKAIATDVLTAFSPLAGTVVGLLSGGSNFDITGGINYDSLEVPDYSIDTLSVESIDYSQLQAFDPSDMGLSQVYSVDVGAAYSGAGLNIPTNYEPTIKDSQLEQISSNYEDSSQDIVNAINEVKEELSRQAEIIASYKMILDTGVLVGELRDPMDKALGNKTKLSTGRGI